MFYSAADARPPLAVQHCPRMAGAGSESRPAGSGARDRLRCGPCAGRGMPTPPHVSPWRKE